MPFPAIFLTVCNFDGANIGGMAGGVKKTASKGVRLYKVIQVLANPKTQLIDNKLIEQKREMQF